MRNLPLALPRGNLVMKSRIRYSLILAPLLAFDTASGYLYLAGRFFMFDLCHCISNHQWRRFADIRPARTLGDGRCVRRPSVSGVSRNFVTQGLKQAIRPAP